MAGEWKFGHNAAVLTDVPDRVRLRLACITVVVTDDMGERMPSPERDLTFSRENVVCLLVQHTQ